MSLPSLRAEPASVEPSRIVTYGRLLSDVFGPSAKFEPDALAWRYRDNPVGHVVGTDAWDGDRIAGHYVTCPVEAKVEGRVLKGLLSLNTATHPDYQGRGLFTELANTTYARAAAEGFEFVVGVANANSTPAFTRKLGFQLVAPLAAGVLLREPRRMADRPCQYEAHWSDASWAWRLSNPAARYASARVGQLRAVWAGTGIPFLSCAAFLPGPGARGGRRPLGLSLFLGLEPRIVDRDWTMLPIPARLRPSPLNLIWRPLAPTAPSTLQAEQVAFNFLDFDPY